MLELPKRMILERVHLLANDIGVAADGAGEEFGWFENGRADFAEAKGGEDRVRGFFDMVPERSVWRKKIASATDGLEFTALLFFWCCV